ncbi:DUF6233 domain-containing protein [Streptomyces roseolus]
MRTVYLEGRSIAALGCDQTRDVLTAGKVTACPYCRPDTELGLQG